MNEKLIEMRDAVLLLLEKLTGVMEEEENAFTDLIAMRTAIQKLLDGETQSLEYALEVFMQWPMRPYGKRWMQPTIIAHMKTKEMLFMYGFVIEPIERSTDHHIVMTWEVGRGLMDGLKDRSERYRKNKEYTPFVEAVHGLEPKNDGVTINLRGVVKGSDPFDVRRSFRMKEPEPLPITVADVLYEGIDEERGRELQQYRLPAPEKCNMCDRSFRREEYIIDGRLKDDITWADMCVACAMEQGAGIGWGNGQLYKRQDDGNWLCVAGFAPEEESEFGD